jgi:fibronectin type 3 domain-containing protein
LEQEKSIKLMRRRELEEALHQAGLTQSDNPDRVLEAGKTLGVTFILFGQVTKKGSQIIAQFKLMDIENAVVLQTWDKTFSGREDILNQMPLMAQSLSLTIADRDKYLASAPQPPKSKPQINIKVENFQARGKGKEVIVTWKFDPQQPIAGFNVYRSEKPEGPYQFLGKTRKNVFSDTTIRKGKSYCYRLGITLNSGKEITTQKIVRVATAGVKLPHAPVIMRAKGFIRRTEIKFVPSLLNEQEKFKITEYKIYRRKEPGKEWLNVSALSAKTKKESKLTFTIEDTDNLEDGQSYAYALTSLDKKKRESPFSDLITVKIDAPPALTVEKGNLLRKVPLIWHPMENVKGYNIYRKIDAQDWEKIVTIRGADKYQFTDQKNMADGKEYQYYLTAFDAKQESGPSNKVKAKTKNLPPHPENLQVQSNLVKSVRLSWTPIQDPDIGGYHIFRGTERKNLVKIAQIKGHNTDTYLDKGTSVAPLRDGTEYFYAIESFNQFEATGKISKAVSATTKPRPEPVRGIKATIEKDNFHLKWGKNSEADIRKYLIFRQRNNGKWKAISELDAEQTEFTDDNLKPEDSYRYSVVAEDKDGLKSDPAESNTVVSPILPVIALEKDNMLRKIDLKWQPLNNIKGYYLYRKSAAEEWRKVAKISGAEKFSYSDKKEMQDGQIYSYYLTTYDEEGETRPSNTITAKTKDPPPVPGDLKTQSDLVKSVKISWTPIEDSDIGGYAIYRSMDGTNFEKIAKAKGQRSDAYLDKGKIFAPLSDGQKYYYSIAGFNLFGAEGPRTPVAIARTKPRPGKCRGLTPTAERNNIMVRWQPNPETDVKFYILYRNKNEGSWSKITSLDSRQTSYRDENLKPEVTYRYKIVVEDQDGLKSEPAESSAVESPIVRTKA